MLRIILVFTGIFVLVAFVSSSSGTGAQVPGLAGGGSDPVTRVFVVNDLNENGVWDEGEPGLEGWGVSVKCGDVIFDSRSTDANGELTFDQEQPRGCLDLHDQFGWLITTLTPISVPDEPESAAFLVRHVGDQVQRFYGLPIVQGMPASELAAVDAFVAGTNCGEGYVTTRFGLAWYELYVLSSEERPGCANEGASITFMVDGLVAGTADFAQERSTQMDLVGGPSPMYFRFWFFRAPAHGQATVQIGSTTCGRGYLDHGPLPPPNMQTVFIVADETTPGCGSPGQLVRLLINGYVVAQGLWREGNSWLGVLGDASCNKEVDSLDASLLLQLEAGVLAELECSVSGDVNLDGSENSVDVALILQREAGLITWFN